MPDLPLSGTVLDGFAAWVAMLRPREDPIPHLKRVDAALAREVALAADHAVGSMLVPAALLRAEPLEQWRQEILHGCVGGAIAGEFLLHMLTLHEHAPQHASANKVHHVVMQDLAATRLGDGRRKAPCSRQTVWGAWRGFRPASHLWGVLRLGLDLDLCCWPKNDRLAPFLAYAEVFAERAEAHGIVAPGELWRVAGNVALPPVSLTIPPPTDWTLARAQDYRAVK